MRYAGIYARHRIIERGNDAFEENDELF